MIIQSPNSMSSGQPMFEFRVEFSRRHEALAPGIRHLTDAAWEHFLELINAVNLAHCAQPRIREGSWYLRHSVVAARQDVSARAACAVEAVQEMKAMMAETGFEAPDFEDLADYAISFAQSICENPRILFSQTPQPSSTVNPAESPQI